MKKFLNNLPDGSFLLDVGCGNGKYLNDDGRLIKFGCDRSMRLCEISASKQSNVFVANCLELPVDENRFDACISIAVIHHLSTEQRRIRATVKIRQ